MIGPNRDKHDTEIPFNAGETVAIVTEQRCQYNPALSISGRTQNPRLSHGYYPDTLPHTSRLLLPGYPDNNICGYYPGSQEKVTSKQSAFVLLSVIVRKINHLQHDCPRIRIVPERYGRADRKNVTNLTKYQSPQQTVCLLLIQDSKRPRNGSE